MKIDISDTAAYMIVVIVFLIAITIGGIMSDKSANALKIEQEKTKQMELSSGRL